MEWIKTKDKTPEEDKIVIGYSNRTKYFYFVAYSGKCWYSNSGSIFAKSTISHWIPLPEIPNK